MSGTGSVSSVTDRALAQVQYGTTPSAATGSIPTAATPGVDATSAGAVPATSYDASSVNGTNPTDAQYAAAAAAQAQAPASAATTTAAASTPAQWNDAVRAEFSKLGLSPNQIAQIEALGLSESDVELAYNKIASDPSVKTQIPDAPVDSAAAGATNAPAATGQTAGATNGGGGIGQGTPAGPPAWNDAWRQKFVDAGAPAELIQQLTFTGAMGADEAQLTASLAQLTDTVTKELATFRTKFPSAYEKLAKSPNVDKATLYQVAAAADSGQISQDQFKQIVDSANASVGGMVKDMFLKQFLPWTIIPGWGALRVAGSLFTGGKDPISGDPIHLDFWNHGFTGWMDAAMAVGGATALFSGLRGAMTVGKGLSFASKATGEVGALAAREGLQNLTMGNKIKAFLPFTQTNRLATGFARLEGLDTAIKTMSEGSAARIAADSLYSKVLSGTISLESNAGIKMSLGGVFNDGRGFLMRRNAPMSEFITRNGQSILKLDSRNQGRAFAALFAGAGVDALSAADRTKLIAQFGGELGKAQNLEGLRNLAISQAGTALGLTAPSNPLMRALGAVKPGPLQDVLKIMANKPPSAVATAFKNPMIKWGVIGAGAIGAGVFGKDFILQGLGMGGAQSTGAQDAQQGAQQAQGQGQTAGNTTQLTADQQAAVAQFAAMPADQQQAFLQTGVQQLTMLQQVAQTGQVPAGLSADDQTLVQQFMSQTADQQAATLQQYQSELELLSQAAQQGAAPAGAGGTASDTGATPAPAATGTAAPQPALTDVGN